jgi:hypothetical protein
MHGAPPRVSASLFLFSNTFGSSSLDARIAIKSSFEETSLRASTKFSSSDDISRKKSLSITSSLKKPAPKPLASMMSLQVVVEGVIVVVRGVVERGAVVKRDVVVEYGVVVERGVVVEGDVVVEGSVVVERGADVEGKVFVESGVCVVLVSLRNVLPMLMWTVD